MRAARIHSFGDPGVIEFEEIDRPRLGEKELLVKVAATSLNHIDLSVRAGELKWLTQFQLPKTLGFDFAGEVVECGIGITSFVTGDRVLAMTGMTSGGAAEFCKVGQDGAARLPDAVGWTEGAALPLAGVTALQALRGFAHLRAGQRLLVNGASGGVGGFAVQVATLLGAHVTAVCRETHFEHVRSLGADETLDYQKNDLESLGEKFDVVFDAAAKLSVEQLRSITHHGGEVVTTRPEPRQLVESLVERVRGSFKIHFMLARPRAGDLAFLARLVESGRLKPCVDKTFSLADAADAHQYLESESVAGKVVLLAT